MKKRKGTKCEFTNTNAVSAQSKWALSLNLCVGFELLIVKQNLGGFVILITIDLKPVGTSVIGFTRILWHIIHIDTKHRQVCKTIYCLYTNPVGTSKNVYLFFFLEAIILYPICYNCGWPNDYYYRKQWTITSETNNAYYYIKFTSLTIRWNQELGHSLGPPSSKHLLY